MPPYNKFKRKVTDLMRKGCTFDMAFDRAKRSFGVQADQADRLLDIKQQLEWELNFGNNDINDNN
jgi:hypothetical protein